MSGFAALSPVTKANIHVSMKKTITHLKWYPSLKLRLFHFVYTGDARRLPPLVLFQMLPGTGRLQHLLFSCSYPGETCNVKLCSTSSKEGCILFLQMQKQNIISVPYTYTCNVKLHLTSSKCLDINNVIQGCILFLQQGCILFLQQRCFLFLQLQK